MKFRIVILLLLVLAACAALSGQNSKKKITITGRVVDADQNPVADAVLVIDNKKTAFTTNQLGSYKIKVKPSSETIGVYIGKTVVIEEPINDRKTINFTLTDFVHHKAEDQMNPNEEEEISVGYGSTKKKNLTQPVSKLDTRDSRFASYRTIYDMIRGELPGVQVNGTSIKIQGATSISGSTQPLFVVDGDVAFSIENISPQMVSSIEVLKGSAAAIYGSRGANGVILINLKSAKDVKKDRSLSK
jgi:TonB-dependent SusC/RagA subfamily outer membrane receptor